MPRAKVRAPLARAAVAIALATVSATAARAAAIEKAIPSVARILFESGRYGELGAAWFDPDQSGSGADLAPLGVPLIVDGETGDLFDPQWALSAAWKADVNDRLSYAILIDQPYGANTDYGAGTFDPLIFTYDGTEASVDTWQLTAVAAYDVVPDVKLYAGARAEWITADAAIPFIAGYTIDADPDWGFGYLVGVAYSRPEIGLRVALTYYSAIEHDLATEEFSVLTQTVGSTTDVKTPQSVSLDAQTGINERTLLFGSIRWVDWSEFDIAPVVYTGIVHAPLVDYGADWWTYTLGVGRQLTDLLAGSLAVAYEPSIGGNLTTLGPYDGKKTLTAALSYDYGPANITGGITYGSLGDTGNPLDTDFDDGSLFGIGIRLGYSF